ncbi:hypothetical protein [uncultured Thiocystis sp.]|jgi:hypothetical protein|uniref:hypothetical protein n=1 Tax=uncultured Thiocystis sp. TaxID=1202134 RepID=UPI0025E94B3D|nr:hypothetical protein [uncultured Thiocystis sp.]
MNTSAIQYPAQPSAIGLMRTRTRLVARGVRAPSIRQRLTVVSRRPVESVLSVDEAMARYLADQPPQLYRGGA